MLLPTVLAALLQQLHEGVMLRSKGGMMVQNEGEEEEEQEEGARWLRERRRLSRACAATRA